jgi:hypothetical protein
VAVSLAARRSAALSLSLTVSACFTACARAEEGKRQPTRGKGSVSADEAGGEGGRGG